MRRAVVLTGLVCMLVGAFLDRRGLGGWDLRGWGLGEDLNRLTAGTCAVFAAAGLLSLAVSRNTRVVGAICAASAVVPGVRAVTDAVESGLPGPSTGVLAVGSAVVVLGTLAHAFERDGARPDGSGGAGRLRVALITAAVVAGTAAAALAAAVVVVEAPVRSSTAAAADPAPVAQHGAGVRWEWKAEGAVREVRAAGAGVVVAGQDGVTALDGVSGAPRWAFARTGTDLADLVVSPDRRSVVVVHVGSASSVAVVTALDALTGERRWETALDGRRLYLLVTDTVVALARELERETESGNASLRAAHLAAHDITTGAPAWTWEAPAGCGTALLRSVAAVRVVPVETECPGSATLYGLDERTGQAAWSLPAPPFPSTSDYQIRATGDGALLVTASPDMRSHWVVEAATGRVVAQLDTEAFPLPAPDGHVQLLESRVIATVEENGTMVPVPAGCEGEEAVAVTGAAVLRLCRGERFYEMQVDSGASVPLGLLLPADWSASLDNLRDTFVVPAPGAVVVAVASNQGLVVGLA